MGFAIKKDIVTKQTEMPRPVSDRIMTMSNDNFAKIISVYAVGIPRTDKLLLIGDFNAKVGKYNEKWLLVMGKHGIGKYSCNGELLLALWSEFELIVTNTIFRQKDERKTIVPALLYDRFHHHEVSG